MFCPKCGTKLDDTTNTCPSCGFALISKEEEEVKEIPVEEEKQENPTAVGETPQVEESTTDLELDSETQALLEDIPADAKEKNPDPPEIIIDEGPEPLPMENHVANQQVTQNNKIAALFLIGIILFIILLLLAIYLIFYA